MWENSLNGHEGMNHFIPAVKKRSVFWHLDAIGRAWSEAQKGIVGNDLTDVVAHMKHLHFDVLHVWTCERTHSREADGRRLTSAVLLITSRAADSPKVTVFRTLRSSLFILCVKDGLRWNNGREKGTWLGLTAFKRSGNYHNKILFKLCEHEQFIQSFME